MRGSSMSKSDLDKEIDEIFKTVNGSGAHACYCDRSVDGGCKCAIKDEYVNEAKAKLKSLIVDARIDELNKYKEHYDDDWDNYIDQRIAELTKEKAK